MVEKGGELKVRDITAIALISRDETTSNARQAEQLQVCLTLIKNNIAKRGLRIVLCQNKIAGWKSFDTIGTKCF
jgi:hypothetical protein